MADNAGMRARLWTAAFNSSTIARAFSRHHLLCVGDSHVRVFNYISEQRLLPQTMVAVCEVPGATAQGLVNPNSKTDALRIFRGRLAQARPFQTAIFQLGEVDCGFVIWYRAEKLGVGVETQLERSLDAYLAFLHEVRLPFIVLSAPLPTIRDGQPWGDVANARREVRASQAMRTELTLEYNARLRSSCEIYGYQFLDVTTEQLDDKTGMIRDELLNRDPLDHHLDDERYAAIVVEGLSPLLR